MQIAKVGTFWKNSGYLLHDGHKNLKIDLEIAEIIEVKVATFNIEIIFLPLLKSFHLHFVLNVYISIS